MIKNNFIITEEEKSHILKLTRLPNHKEPVNLLEQLTTQSLFGNQKSRFSTLSNDPKTNDDSKLDVVWNSDIAKQKSDDDLKLKSKETSWNTILKGGKMSLINFDDKRQVANLTNYVVNQINLGWRSNAFGYFLDALNNKNYTDLSKKIESAARFIKVEVESDGSYDIDTWDALSEPESKENYNQEDVSGPGNSNYFGDINQFQLKKMGLVKQPGYKRGADLDAIKSGMKTLTPEVCQRLLADYLLKGYRESLSNESRKELKYNIAWCYTTDSNAQPKKNIFGKVHIKRSGTPLQSLSNKEQKNLQVFLNKPDGDPEKIYIDNVNRNYMSDEENKRYKPQ
jgi:hypothetical protein